MALDTTVGGADADSYGTLVGFQAYAAAVGWVLTKTDAEQEQDLRRSVPYIDREYTHKGTKAASTQSLLYPVINAGNDCDGFTIPSDDIPQPIIDAQFELAWIQHEGQTLFATQLAGAISEEMFKAEGVETETKYFNGRESPKYPSVDNLLRCYIVGGGDFQPILVRG